MIYSEGIEYEVVGICVPGTLTYEYMCDIGNTVVGDHFLPGGFNEGTLYTPFDDFDMMLHPNLANVVDKSIDEKKDADEILKVSVEALKESLIAPLIPNLRRTVEKYPNIEGVLLTRENNAYLASPYDSTLFTNRRPLDMLHTYGTHCGSLLEEDLNSLSCYYADGNKNKPKDRETIQKLKDMSRLSKQIKDREVGGTNLWIFDPDCTTGFAGSISQLEKVYSLEGPLKAILSKR